MIYDAEAKTNNVSENINTEQNGAEKRHPAIFHLYDRNNETINLFSATFRFNIKKFVFFPLNFSDEHLVSEENYNFEVRKDFRNQF